MLFSYILLHSASTMSDYLVGFLLCIVPFVLGVLLAYNYFKVSALRDQVAELTAKVNAQTAEITELRMKLSQTEADLEHKAADLRKSKNDLIMCESERNALREQANAGDLYLYR